MKLQDLCTNCMLGSVEQGICSVCGKSKDAEKYRHISALPARHLLGQQYYIGKVLGSGGFGITYLALDMKSGRRVAIKELFPRSDVSRTNGTTEVKIVSGQEEFFDYLKQRFSEEAQALYAFSNEPNIINVYRLIEENQTVYYAMELLEGMDLKKRLELTGESNDTGEFANYRQFTGIGWEELSVYMKNILQALISIHERKLIHRDISPDNIFLVKKGSAKLIDFGALRSYNNPKGLTTILKHNYAPCEQYQSNGKQGPWTDIYALSVTMYYALSGVLPPKAPDRMISDKTIPLEQLCPNLPNHVIEAIKKGMEPRIEHRFATAKEFMSHLFPNESQNHFDAEKNFYPNNHTNNRNFQNSAHHGTFKNQKKEPIRTLYCVEGMFKGKEFTLKKGECLKVGRDVHCEINYPQNTRGISRKQCSIMMDAQGHLFVKDEQSTYGTKLNYKRIQGGWWYECVPGNIINFGNESYQIM